MHSYRRYVWFLIINPATVELNSINVNLVKLVNFIFLILVTMKSFKMYVNTNYVIYSKIGSIKYRYD